MLDTGAGNVKVFDFDGTPIDTFPHAGDAPLVTPSAIAVGLVRHEVLVPQWNNLVGPRIGIYSYEGIYLGEISALSGGAGRHRNSDSQAGCTTPCDHTHNLVNKSQPCVDCHKHDNAKGGFIK